jgi:sec-independent protein translocase protein TatA
MYVLLANIFSSWDIIIVAIVVLLLFGNRLPMVMRNLGQGVTEFKKGVAGIDDETDQQKKNDVTRKVDEGSKTTEERPV